MEDALGPAGLGAERHRGRRTPRTFARCFSPQTRRTSFGVPALLGRGLIPSDAPAGQDAQPVAVLSYSFWQRHLGGSADVIGKSLQLDRKNYTIVGVLPRRFGWGYGDVYLPLKLTNDPAQPLFVSHPACVRAVNPSRRRTRNFNRLFEQFARETPARYPEKFTTRTERLIDPYRRRLGHYALPAIWRCPGASVHRLRECVDLIAGARRFASTRIGRAECTWGEPSAHPQAVAHGVRSSIARQGRCSACLFAYGTVRTDR